MNYEKALPSRWVSPRMRFGRMPATAAAMSVLVAALSAGCSSGIKGSDRSEGWYDKGSLQEFVAETQAPLPPLIDNEYVIGVGDELQVVFPYHTNLTERDLIVRRDGRISLPYVGDQMAAGITPMDLDSLLTVRFSEILREPNLSVIVSTPALQKVYVLGYVRTPGKVEFDDELSMLQAVSEARA